MIENNEAQGSRSVEALKWVFVVSLVALAVAINIVGEAYSPYARWAAIGVLSAAAVGIALLTSKGARFLQSLSNSRAEIRKVVWPTNEETNRTTLIVLVVVVIMAIFLYLVDALFGWIVHSFLG